MFRKNEKFIDNIVKNGVSPKTLRYLIETCIESEDIAFDDVGNLYCCHDGEPLDSEIKLMFTD